MCCLLNVVEILKGRAVRMIRDACTTAGGKAEWRDLGIDGSKILKRILINSACRGLIHVPAVRVKWPFLWPQERARAPWNSVFVGSCLTQTCACRRVPFNDR